MSLLRKLNAQALPLGLAGLLLWGAPAPAQTLETETVKVSASRVEKELLDGGILSRKDEILAAGLHATGGATC